MQDGTYFIHFRKPIMHDLLLMWCHCSKRVEKIPGPHNLRIHDYFINQMVGMRDQLKVGLATRVTGATGFTTTC